MKGNYLQILNCYNVHNSYNISYYLRKKPRFQWITNLRGPI